MGTLAGVVLVVVAAGGSLFWMMGGGATTLSGQAGYEQRGASGLAERIFFGLFGAPRDPEKEKALSWTRAPVVPRTQTLPPPGFTGRGASRRW